MESKRRERTFNKHSDSFLQFCAQKVCFSFTSLLQLPCFLSPGSADRMKLVAIEEWVLCSVARSVYYSQCFHENWWFYCALLSMLLSFFILFSFFSGDLHCVNLLQLSQSRGHLADDHVSIYIIYCTGLTNLITSQKHNSILQLLVNTEESIVSTHFHSEATSEGLPLGYTVSLLSSEEVLCLDLPSYLFSCLLHVSLSQSLSSLLPDCLSSEPFCLSICWSVLSHPGALIQKRRRFALWKI